VNTDKRRTAMSDQYLVNTVLSSSSGTLGRSLNAAGRHHFVIDSPTLAEEITSVDAFLAGISSCGVNLVERVAAERGVAVQRVEVTIEGRRRADSRSVFDSISLRFRLTGPGQAQAEALVGAYTDG
jgi:uncharacterized OsmC-like protein